MKPQPSKRSPTDSTSAGLCVGTMNQWGQESREASWSACAAAPLLPPPPSQSAPDTSKGALQDPSRDSNKERAPSRRDFLRTLSLTGATAGLGELSALAPPASPTLEGKA